MFGTLWDVFDWLNAAIAFGFNHRTAIVLGLTAFGIVAWVFERVVIKTDPGDAPLGAGCIFLAAVLFVILFVLPWLFAGGIGCGGNIPCGPATAPAPPTPPLR
jgi:hypothetical protein